MDTITEYQLQASELNSIKFVSRQALLCDTRKQLLVNQTSQLNIVSS